MTTDWWRSEVERPWVGMTSESMTDVEHAHAELVATLDSIKERLNIPVQVHHADEFVGNKLRTLRDHRPLVFTLVLAGVTLAAGAAILASFYTRE